jgi:hypothetical protein
VCVCVRRCTVSVHKMLGMGVYSWRGVLNPQTHVAVAAGHAFDCICWCPGPTIVCLELELQHHLYVHMLSAGHTLAGYQLRASMHCHCCYL